MTVHLRDAGLLDHYGHAIGGSDDGDRLAVDSNFLLYRIRQRHIFLEQTVLLASNLSNFS